jgi:hypothetical protein
LRVFASVSRPVRETLARNTLGNERRTFPVADLTRIPLEIPLAEITGQMGFADRMMRAEHGALQEAKTAFRRVDMNEAGIASVFVRLVPGKLPADRLVGRGFIDCLSVFVVKYIVTACGEIGVNCNAQIAPSNITAKPVGL